MKTTSKKMIEDMEIIIQAIINEAKEEKRTPTRVEIIEKITNRLETLIKLESGNNDRVLIISGIAIGISLVLRLDDKLKMVE